MYDDKFLFYTTHYGQATYISCVQVGTIYDLRLSCTLLLTMLTDVKVLLLWELQLVVCYDYGALQVE